MEYNLVRITKIMVIFAAAVSFGVSLEEPSTKTKKKK